MLHIVLHCVPISYSGCFFQLSATLPHIPRVLPYPSATIAGHFGRAGGHPRASCGVFRVPLDGQSIDRPGAAVPVYFPFWLPSGSGRWSADPVSCPRPAVNGSRFTSSGSRPRFPGSGCLLPVCNLSDIAPDRATLNPFFFLPCVYFLNMVFLEGQKVVFWTFRYWLNMP